MNARTNIQIINGADGAPAFVVMPYADYVKQQKSNGDEYVPHEVVSLMVDKEWPIVRAWREHLGLTQLAVSKRLGISQSAYAQQETNAKLRKTSREKIAAALGISPEQLDV